MRASRRATLLSVPVGEERAFLRNAVEVRGSISHDPEVIGADVVPADVVAHDEKNVWFLLCHCLLSPIVSD